MKVFEYLDHIRMMHKLVSMQRTGTPEEFANYLGVSRSSMYELINELRSRGAPILYSKSAKTFFYKKPYDITVNCLFRPLTYKEEKENSGGINNFSRILFFRTLFTDLRIVTFLC